MIDGRVDEYALAVTIYELLAGTKPFTGTAVNLIVEVMTYPVPPLAARRPDLPASLCAAVHRGLAKAPGDRFGSCGALAAAVLRDVPPMADEPDVVRLLCPNQKCARILRLSAAAAGHRGQCPKCHGRMQVAADLGRCGSSTRIGGRRRPWTTARCLSERCRLFRRPPRSTRSGFPSSSRRRSCRRVCGRRGRGGSSCPGGRKGSGPCWRWPPRWPAARWSTAASESCGPTSMPTSSRAEAIRKFFPPRDAQDAIRRHADALRRRFLPARAGPR